ncbi:MAG: hypothetical protein M0Z94_04905 [Dehalococcoidales bacterium]|nr:hypothetical protein [Dehalococcoidales bacterium]
MQADNGVVILDRYVDSLNMSATSVAVLLAYSQNDGLLGLLSLARRLKQALRPVEPSSTFRQSLHLQLVAMAGQRPLAEQKVSWPETHKRGLIISAAVGSVLSVAGVTAVILRWRSIANRAA